MKDFRKLRVWQGAHEITLLVYRSTVRFPKEELYGLTNQIRRASVSIAANIAEGAGRRTDADMARFLQIAFGSACELEYHLLLSRDFQYLPTKDHDAMQNSLVELKKMLASFLKKLTADS